MYCQFTNPSRTLCCVWLEWIKLNEIEWNFPILWANNHNFHYLFHSILYYFLHKSHNKKNCTPSFFFPLFPPITISSSLFLLTIVHSIPFHSILPNQTQHSGIIRRKAYVDHISYFLYPLLHCAYYENLTLTNHFYFYP